MDDLSARMAAIAAHFTAGCPSRVVTREFLDFPMQKKADLQKGILTLISLGESDYKNLKGRACMDGTHHMTLTGQLQLGEKESGLAIETAELELFEEARACLRTLPLALCTLLATGFRQSGQVQKPFGWIVVDLELLT